MPVSPPPNATLVSKGELLTYWQWDQRLFDGSTRQFECVTRPDTAVIIPFLRPDTVILTKQSHSEKTHAFFDFPGGRIEPGEEAKDAVQRELQEETGYRVDRCMEWHRDSIQSLVRFEQLIFVGTPVTHVSEPHREAGEHVEVLEVLWKDVVDLCLKGKLRQPHVMLAVLQMEFDPEAKKRLHNWLHTS